MADNLNSQRGIHVEILQKNNSVLKSEQVISIASKWISSHKPFGKQKIISNFDDDVLAQNVSTITICDNNSQLVNGEVPPIYYDVYSFNSTSPEIQEVEEEDQHITTQWILPTQDFNGLWESLIYESEVKDGLLNYVSTALRFSEKSVNPNIVSWNRMILLHGPPGTGKTSLCKALAQKVSIRFSSKFAYGILVEVNTHSLFSKWFSESGKLVTKLFHNIINLVEDTSVLVIVLLDEVETLARSRSSALTGNEPSDALRVVNAFLTHLDMIKRYPNVLILTTSNITDAIDVALIDRADIKQYIGLPNVEAIYQIYSSCIEELSKAGIICTSEIVMQMENLLRQPDSSSNGNLVFENRDLKLVTISKQSIGLSGRTLRKMPFIACSLFLGENLVTLDDFLDALSKAVEKHWHDVKHLNAHV
ncbi:pachytene checkpoint protein 2 homolog [Parasteatoda tepidariorum]|nr:pachytene checkpoint protein 2 homolog [Parasteatoda tepidariorum]